MKSKARVNSPQAWYTTWSARKSPNRAPRVSKAAATWLIEQGKVPAERIFLVPGKAKAEAPAASGGRVEFALR